MYDAFITHTHTTIVAAYTPKYDYDRDAIAHTHIVAVAKTTSTERAQLYQGSRMPA